MMDLGKLKTLTDFCFNKMKKDSPVPPLSTNKMLGTICRTDMTREGEEMEQMRQGFGIEEHTTACSLVFCFC